MAKSYSGPFLRSLIAPVSPHGLGSNLVPFDRPRGELPETVKAREARPLVRGHGSVEVGALVSFSP